MSVLSDVAPYELRCSMGKNETKMKKCSWSVDKDDKQIQVTDGTQATLECNYSSTTLKLKEHALAGMFTFLTKIQKWFRNYCICE